MENALQSNILKLIVEWKTKTERNMLSILKQKKKGDSRIAKQLKLTVNVKGDQITVTNELPDYAIFVDQGRKPGKQPPIKSIQEWCKRKGIIKEAAYPIARNVGLHGIKPTNFLNPMRKFDDLIKELQSEMVKSTTKEIKDGFDEINNTTT